MISTHALREEGDEFLRIIEDAGYNFYPRPPRGGRLFFECVVVRLCLFLPTPSARRATGVTSASYQQIKISTHALREEGDHDLGNSMDDAGKFLPTPSARRATVIELLMGLISPISTHALREEGDVEVAELFTIPSIFLPTPSARRATVCSTVYRSRESISTHALREEGDSVR